MTKTNIGRMYAVNAAIKPALAKNWDDLLKKVMCKTGIGYYITAFMAVVANVIQRRTRSSLSMLTWTQWRLGSGR